MSLYDWFAIFAIAGGVFSGVYFSRLFQRHYKTDKLLSLLIFVYIVFVCFWLAGVYAATLLDFIPVSSLTIGIYTRPATAVGLWVPMLIMRRVEMIRGKIL